MSNSTLDMLIRAVGDFSDLDAKFNRFAQRLRQYLSGTGTGGGFNNPGWLNQFLGGRQTRSPQDFLTTIDRLERALLRTGQTSQRLNQIRLPVGQFQEATKYLTALERQIALLGTSAWGRDLRQRVTASHQNLRSPFSWDWTAMYGSAQAGHAARMRFYEQAFRGMEHPGGGGGGGGGGWGGGITAAGAWMGRAAGGGILRSGGALLGMAGVGSVMGALFAGYREHIDTLESVDSLYKSMGSDKGFKGLEGDVKQLGAELQLAASDAAKLAESFMRASGSVDDDMLQRAQGAGQFGRGYGLDPNNTASSFARAELVGYGNTRQSQREFAALLAQTIGSSGMYGRSEQILGDLVGEIENIATQQGRTATTDEMGRFAALLSSAYLDPALKGGGGQSVLGNIRSLGAGRDAAGTSLAWGAFGAATNFDPYKVALLQDSSRWASLKDLTGEGGGVSGAQMMHDYAKELAVGMPGANERERYAFAMREMGVGNIPLNLKMYDLMETKFQNGTPEGFMDWIGQATGTDIENVNLVGLGDLQRMYEQRNLPSAEHDAWLRSKAEEYQNNDTLPEKMQQDLKEALATGGEESAARLRELMPKVVGYDPNVKTDAFTNRKTTADLMTSLANLSSNMQPVIEGLKKFATNLSAVSDYILTGNFDALKTVWESTKDSAGDVMGKVQNGIPGFFESQGIHRNPSASGVTGGASSSASQVEQDWDTYLRNLEQERGLPVGILSGTEAAETGHIKDPAKRDVAVSPAGAMGRFQFMPATAARFNLTDTSNRYESARAAADYHQANIAYLTKHGIEPSVTNLAAAYNAGEEKVRKYGGVPPFAETLEYAPKVARVTSEVAARQSAVAPAAPPEVTPAVAPAAPVAPVAPVAAAGRWESFNGKDVQDWMPDPDDLAYRGLPDDVWTWQRDQDPNNPANRKKPPATPDPVLGMATSKSADARLDGAVDVTINVAKDGKPVAQNFRSFSVGEPQTPGSGGTKPSINRTEWSYNVA